MFAYIKFFSYIMHTCVYMLAKEKEIYKEKEAYYPHILILSAFIAVMV